MKKKIVFASDHAAADFVDALCTHVKALGYTAEVLNTQTPFTYAQAADAVVQPVLGDENVLGIACCGTGIGVSMRANRYNGVRATLIHDAFTAEMASLHSNANVVCMGARVLNEETAKKLLDIVLNTPFEGGRHIARLEALDMPTEESQS